MLRQKSRRVEYSTVPQNLQTPEEMTMLKRIPLFEDFTEETLKMIAEHVTI